MRRIVFTEGGIGGTGKTLFARCLREWYVARGVPHAALDMDVENPYSLRHFYVNIPRVDARTADGLDPVFEPMDKGEFLVLADLPPGTRRVTKQWFDTMYEGAQEELGGVKFTAVGLVTTNDASVASLLEWAVALQDRVQYLVVKNSITESPDFSHWEQFRPAVEFRRNLRVTQISMEHEPRTNPENFFAELDRVKDLLLP